MKHAPIVAILIMASAMSACTAQQGYTAGQAWQRNQCAQILDKSEYDRCMRDAAVSYETYREKRVPDQQ